MGQDSGGCRPGSDALAENRGRAGCWNPTGLDFALNPVEIVHRIARAGGGRPYPIYAPMWVEDQAAVEGLRSERSVAEALALYHRIDVLVVGIGSWQPSRIVSARGVSFGLA